MKTFIVAFLVGANSLLAFNTNTDSLARIAAGVINDERRRLGIDTLEYEADTFCFATDWADSTHRYFNVDKHLFTREAAHRNCDERMEMYETFRNKEWRYFAECVAFGKTSGKICPAVDFAKGLLGSKDHYKVLMKKGYKKITIGVFMRDGFFNMVVFTTTEFE